MSVVIYFFLIIAGSVQQRKNWKQSVGERQEDALQHIQDLSEKTIKRLNKEISAKNMTPRFNDTLIEMKKSDVTEWERKAEGELSRVTEELDEATRKRRLP